MLGDIHNYESRINSVLKRIENNGLAGNNKDDLLEFYENMGAEGLSRGRIAKYLNHLIKIEGWLNKPFAEVTKKDIVKLINTIENQGYTANTKHDYKIAIKKFFRWFGGTDDYPEEVKWIKSTVKRNESKIPEELLTMDEIKGMIDAAEHPRNKALASAIYESGCRPTEFLTLCIKHVVFDKYGVQLTIARGKTGMRKIRLVASVPHLASWIEMHPMKDNPDAPIWITIGTRNRNKRFVYRNLSKCLNEIARKAGIKKRMYPYLYRHTRATHLANKLTEAQMCQYFGWVQGSNMPRTYVHLSGRDLDGPILQMYGLKKDEEKDDIDFSPKKCHRCEKINPPGGKICSRCGSPLDANEAMKLEKEQEQVNIKMKATIKYLLMNPKTRNSTIEIMNQVNYEFPEYNNIPKGRIT